MNGRPIKICLLHILSCIFRLGLSIILALLTMLVISACLDLSISLALAEKSGNTSKQDSKSNQPEAKPTILIDQLIMLSIPLNDPNFQIIIRNLNDKKLSPELNDRIEKSMEIFNIKVSPNARILVKQTNVRWCLYDYPLAFSIRNEKDKLNIYVSFMDEVFLAKLENAEENKFKMRSFLYSMIMAIFLSIICVVVLLIMQKRNLSKQIEELKTGLPKNNSPFGVSNLSGQNKFIDLKALDPINKSLNLILKALEIDSTPNKRINNKDILQLSSIQTLSRAEELCSLYDKAVEDAKIQSEFRQRYRPDRLCVVNAMERKGNSRIDPIFKKANNGEYFIIKLNGDNVIVPCFNLDFDLNAYGPSAMGDVFECLGFDRNLTYRKVKVVEPAIFKPEPGTEIWKLEKPGKLDLGQGE